MTDDLILLEIFEVFEVLLLLSPGLILLLVVPTTYFTKEEEAAALRTLKETLGFATVFGGVLWYTMDPALKRVITRGISSADVKITEDGLEYRPFSAIPVSIVISCRDAKPTLGFRISGEIKNLTGCKKLL